MYHTEQDIFNETVNYDLSCEAPERDIKCETSFFIVELH